MAQNLRSLHRSQSLHEQTYQVLRQAILAGDLAPGKRLIETQLAKQLEVSRTPVREALRQLQRENLVNADVNGGLCVATLSIIDAAQLYDCRIALEELSVAEACRHASKAQLEQIGIAVLDPEKTTNGEPNQLLHIDYQFHRLLAESSGNPWLVSLLNQLFDKMALLRLRTLQNNPRVLEIRSEHCRIYEAVANRDSQAATQAIKSHLSAGKKRVILEIEQLKPNSLQPEV